MSRDIRPPVLGTLMTGIGLALARPRVWLPLTALVLILGFVASYPVHDAASTSFNHVAGFEDEQPWVDLGVVPRWMFDDQAREHGGMGVPAALAPLFLLMSLFGVLITAGWMETAVHRRKQHGLRAFLSGGGQHFFPFLRLWGVALAGYAFCTWLVYGLPGEWLKEQFFPAGNPERATSESYARWIELTYSIVYLGCILKVEIITDLARSTLVVNGRRSAFAATLRGIGFWVRRWRACFTLVGTGFLLEAGFIALLVGLHSVLDFPLMILALAMPAGRVILRGGRQAGLALYYHRYINHDTHHSIENSPQQPSPSGESAAWSG
ncbi:MAG: hypothetical protein MK209_01220 [Planctomycetes bacterium]|nr:hypothetical protein [Planctomycetota bacterium]